MTRRTFLYPAGALDAPVLPYAAPAVSLLRDSDQPPCGRTGVTVISIRVNGIPAPQGSKQRFPNGGMRESSRAVGPWREAIRAETQRALESGAVPPAAGEPVSVYATFYLPRSASLPKRVTLPAKRPDLDKLVRALLDGLAAGGALANDGQVTGLFTVKLFADHGNAPGVSVRVAPVAADLMPL